MIFFACNLLCFFSESFSIFFAQVYLTPCFLFFSLPSYQGVLLTNLVSKLRIKIDILYIFKNCVCSTLLYGDVCFVQAVTAMVQQAMQYIDETPDLETRIELIKTLNNVSAGKVISYL